MTKHWGVEAVMTAGCWCWEEERQGGETPLRRMEWHAQRCTGITFKLFLNLNDHSFRQRSKNNKQLQPRSLLSALTTVFASTSINFYLEWTRDDGSKNMLSSPKFLPIRKQTTNYFVFKTLFRNNFVSFPKKFKREERLKSLMEVTFDKNTKTTGWIII